MKNIFYVISVFVFILSITILYLGASCYYVSGGEGISSELGEAMGRSLAFMLIAYPVWKWGLLKMFGELKKGGAILCYCLLILLCSSYQSVGLSIKANQLKKSEKIMSEIAKSSLTGDSRILPQDGFSTEEYGDMGPVLTLIREVVDYSNKETQRLIKAEEEAINEGMLSPDCLCDVNRVQKALDCLGILEREINESEDRRTKRIVELDSEIELLVKQHYNGRKSLIEGYNRGKKISLGLMNEYYRIQRDIVIEMQELLRFLQSVQDTYWEENGVMMFATDELANSYNAHILRIVELSEEEELNREKINTQQQKIVDKWTSSNI